MSLYCATRFLPTRHCPQGHVGIVLFRPNQLHHVYKATQRWYRDGLCTWEERMLFNNECYRLCGLHMLMAG